MMPHPADDGERPVAPTTLFLPPAARAVAELEPRQCRWPRGDTDDDVFRFCGAAARGRSSYCAAHRLRASGAAR